MTSKHTPPCDCIEQFNGTWVIGECQCMNLGDVRDAQSWCDNANRIERGLRIVFDGPPSHESGRFVEVENARGESIRAGRWCEREDGLWELRLDISQVETEARAMLDALRTCLNTLIGVPSEQAEFARNKARAILAKFDGGTE